MDADPNLLEQTVYLARINPILFAVLGGVVLILWRAADFWWGVPSPDPDPEDSEPVDLPPYE